ncbi:MAG: hypothetical protein JW878_04090 [Methanomicrobia archaeon]|nr:hypothetical protein [Methanomicrobia archaeon]
MAEEVLKAEIRRLEGEEKAHAKKVRLKQAYAERARAKRDLKRMEKTQAEEEHAIAVLQKIQAEKKHAETGLLILRYVERHQPVESATIAQTFSVPPETLEEYITSLGLVNDSNGNIFANKERMTEITVTRKFEAWEQERKGVMERLKVIAERYPGLTRDELKEVYKCHYPDDDRLDRYLRERELVLDHSDIKESRAGTWIIIASVVLLVFLVLITAVSVHDPGVVEEAWGGLYVSLFGP